MDVTPHIQWSTSCFRDTRLEIAYRKDSWKSIRLQTALTLIGFSLAWLATVSLDNLYLRGTPYFEVLVGARTTTGIVGVATGVWVLIARPQYERSITPVLIYFWISLAAITALLVAWVYPFLETTADGRTDILLSTCYWMSLQILGLGTALSAWRNGIALMALLYAVSYVVQAYYWAPQLEHTLEGQMIVIIAACIFAVILSYLFARRGRQRFYMTKLYEEAKVVAENAQQFTTFLLAATGHDIRQPIFALNLNASMLEDLIRDRDWEGASKLAGRQRQALSGVAGLISSVLELSQLDTNRRLVNPEPLALGSVMDTVLKPIGPIAADRGIDLRYVRSSLTVDTDRGVVEHILANLVANAVSHAEAKRVLIGARRCGEFVDIMVIDDGKGLGDQVQTLTIADIQPDKSRHASRGLGVEIMFRLAEKAALDLTLTSRPHHGVAACLRCPTPR